MPGIWKRKSFLTAGTTWLEDKMSLVCVGKGKCNRKIAAREKVPMRNETIMTGMRFQVLTFLYYTAAVRLTVLR